MTLTPAEARQRAVGLAADTMGELITFWGFKASMGRIWTLLYLSPAPLPADKIAQRTQLSAGSVSMALTDLCQWGIVDRAMVPGARKRHYRAETDVWAIVRRITRDRELRLVGRAVERFSTAVALLEASLDANPEDLDTVFMLERLKGLLKLAKIGYTLVEGFAEVGRFSLDPIRGALSVFRADRHATGGALGGHHRG